MRIGGGTGGGDRLAAMDEQAKLVRVFNYPFGDIYRNYLAKVAVSYTHLTLPTNREV